MGWKVINGQRYYYRYQRINGKVVAFYGGTGERGEFEAMLDAREREIGRARKAAEQQRREADREFDAMLDGRLKAAKEMASEFLRANGYHQHKRSWRRKRETSMNDNSTALATVSKPDPTAATPVKKPTVKRRQTLDALAASAIVTRLIGSENDPHGQRKLFVDDIASQAERLAGENPSELEWALCQTGALAWGALRVTEYETGMNLASRTPEKIKHDDDRIERAQRRYLSILRMLAQIRKVSAPGVLVVNQGTNQQTVIGSNPVQ